MILKTCGVTTDPSGPSIQWKDKIPQRLDDTAYENEQVCLHTQRIIQLAPIGIPDKR
jgi:hypothetical protein